MGKIDEEYPQPDWGSLIGMLIGLILGLVICACLGSCKAHESVITTRTVYDTVWSVKSAQNAKNDSVIYRERVEIVPHIVKVGDTTIVYSDTTIVRVAERNLYRTNNVYSDQGKILRDTAYIEKQVPTKQLNAATKHKGVSKWHVWLFGILIGVLLAVAWKDRKKIVKAFLNRTTLK